MRDRSFIAVCALILVNQIGFGLITPVLPAFAKSFGLDPLSIGLVIGIYGFARFIANVPAGQLAERRGRRQVLILGTLITAVASALMATAENLPQLLAYRLLAGLGAATVITAGQIMVGDIATPENRGRLMSIYQGFFLLGVTAGPAPGGVLADHFGVRAPFVAYAAFSLAACVLSMIFIRETKPARAPHPEVAAADARSTNSAEVQNARRELRRTLFGAPFLLISAVSFAQFVARTGALFTVVPLLGAEVVHLSASDIGYAFTLVNVLQISTVYLSGSFADRFGRKPVIAPATVVAGIGMAMFAYSSSWWMFMASAAVWGLGAGISGPAPGAYVADLAPTRTRAQVFGYFRSMSDAGYIVGPLALGWITAQYGYHLPLLLTAGMIVVSGALFWVFAPEFHQRPNKQNAPAA